MAYQSIHTGQNIDDAITDMQSLQSIILNTVYPVGSLYTSFNSTNPANIIGGTWIQIQDCFLMAAGSSYTIGTSGGSATHTHTSAAHTHTTAGHTLTEAELPYIDGSMTWHGQEHGTHVYNISGHMTGSKISGMYQTTGQTSGAYSYGYTGFAFGGNQSHSHGNTGSTTPGATGASSSLPPYKTIYMWQRTA